MEIKINKKNELVVKHKLKRNELYSFKKTGKFQTVSIYTKPQIVGGFSNSTEDNQAVLLIDYDGVDINVVLDDFKFIQKKYDLPQAYLFRTKIGNYHVVCLKKFLNYEIHEILLHTRCDENYKSMPLRSPFRSYILRLTDKKGSAKPKFVKLIGEDEHNEFEISSAHKSLFTKIYKKIKHPEYENEDNLKELSMQRYETK